MRRRVTLLLAAAGMAVMMLALTGIASAGDGNPTPPGGDTRAPRVVKVVPANNATGFDRDANLRAKFSEAMRASSVSVVLYEGSLSREDVNPDPQCPPSDPGCTDGAPPPFPASVSYNATTKTATLDPFRLDARTPYTAVVEGAGDYDAKAVRDRAGNPLARDFIWRFRTGAQ